MYFVKNYHFPYLIWINGKVFFWVYLQNWKNTSPGLKIKTLSAQNPVAEHIRAEQCHSTNLYLTYSTATVDSRTFQFFPPPSQTMSESICRSLRDGALEGELSPTLTIKDTLSSPFAFNVFSHILLQLSSPKSHSNTAILIVALSRSPSFYAHLLKNKGIELSSSNKW